MEITEIPLLSPEEIADVEQHSLLNLINVLQSELICIGLDLTGNCNLLHDSMASCIRIKESFCNPEKTKHFAQNASSESMAILAEINAISAKYPGKSEVNTKASRDNIVSVLHILEERAQETLTRLDDPDKWCDFSPEEIHLELLEFFAAIEKNSKGRYRFIYNIARQQPSDYFCGVTIEATVPQLAMPLLVKDSMRDIIANARKYTAPGGTINVGILETATELRIVVQDTGCGIPADELQSVFHFGVRGSNAQHMQTMGGGLGLTKAFLVTKRFGGQLWISSELGVGTRITIAIPR
jgi:signal transduction histidine kinase